MFYYQKINEIGKEVAVIASSAPINDPTHYRPIEKEYYEAVVEFLHEQAKENSVGE